MSPRTILARYGAALAGLGLAATLVACSKSPPHVSLWSLDNRALCERQYKAPVSIREGIAEDFTIRLANYRIESCSEIRGVGNVGVITMDLSNPAYPRALILGKAVGAGEISFTCKDDDDGTQTFALTVNVVAQDAVFPTTDRCKEDAEDKADAGDAATDASDASKGDASDAGQGDAGADGGG
jgi:hypothetical protein